MTPVWIWASLGGVAAVLVVASTATARRLEGSVPGRGAYLDGWSELHGGYRPEGTVFTGRWLALVHALAAPLAARGVLPDLLTGWGVLISLAVPAIAAEGGRWPLLAIMAVVTAGMLDNLDGAVAVLSDRTTRFGFVLDSLADRLSDSMYVLALWALGAPAAVCVAGGALAALQEYARARAGAVGMGEIGVVTVWERPTRVVLTAFVLLGCALMPSRAATAAHAGGWAWVGLGLVGMTQLLVVVRRRLAS